MHWAHRPKITNEPFRVMQTPLTSSGLYITNWQVRTGPPDPSLAEEDQQCLKKMDLVQGEGWYVRRQTDTSESPESLYRIICCTLGSWGAFVL